MICIVDDVRKKKQWNDVAMHPLQSWEWGEFRAKMGISVKRFAEVTNNTIANTYLTTFHTIPYTSYQIGYTPRSSMPPAALLNALKRENKLISNQFEPAIEIDKKLPLDYRLKRSSRPLFTPHTLVLDLSKSEEELLNKFHPKTRYNIKVAQKHDVCITEDNSPTSLETFLRLTQETTQRQKFFAHSPHYFMTMWNTLHPAGIARIFTATYQKEVLASWILFVWKNTIYYPYGASSRNHREVMAPTLLLWEITKQMKREGITRFDMWGSLGPNPDQNDPWYGFHRFKLGFNPMLVTYIGSYDYVLRPFMYSISQQANSLRWQLLHSYRHLTSIFSH